MTALLEALSQAMALDGTERRLRSRAEGYQPNNGGFSSPMPTFGGLGLPFPGGMGMGMGMGIPSSHANAIASAQNAAASNAATQSALFNLMPTPLNDGPFNSRKPTFAGPSTTSVGSGGGGGTSLPVMTPVANRPLHERAASQIMNSPDYPAIANTPVQQPNVITGTSTVSSTASPAQSQLLNYFNYLSNIGLQGSIPGAPHVPIGMTPTSSGGTDGGS